MYEVSKEGLMLPNRELQRDVTPGWAQTEVSEKKRLRSRNSQVSVHLTPRFQHD